MKTLRERYTAALIARGETLVKSTHKYDVYTRQAGPGGSTYHFYYIGRAGALRVGSSIASSTPCSDRFKQSLLDSLHDLSV
jgi:hypothetical protein